MHRRQPLPRLWLMTDERQGDGLWAALERLPAGSGIVLRHYSLAPPARRSLFEAVKAAAQDRQLLLLLAGPAQLARSWGADGSHGRGGFRPIRGLLRSAPVHDRRELAAAVRTGVDLVFLSPLFPTRSHAGEGALGRLRFAVIARKAAVPVIALGGIDAKAATGLRRLKAYGWAGIDAWTG